MAIASIQSTLANKLGKLARLEKNLSNEHRKEVDKTKRIHDLQKSITKYTSASMLNSKNRQILRLSQEITQIKDKQSDISKKIADMKNQIFKTQQQLAREEERERKKVEEFNKRLVRERLANEQAISLELEKQKELLKPYLSEATETSHKEYDVFISHASEDKEELVRPMANEFKELGFSVWYDEFELTVGDSLRRSIDNGLKCSRYGIVVLSNAFFKKGWPQYELDGLLQREMGQGEKVILPIWHRVTKDEVRSYSPSLSDKFGLNTTQYSIKEIAEKISVLLEEN